jgi:hypothetical protein
LTIRSAHFRPATAGTGVLLAACGGFTSIAPEHLSPLTADTAAAWAAPFQPRTGLQFDIRWRFENSDGKAAGRAVARFAPPDTLRFDYRGPFGRAGGALVVGSEAVWAEPAEDVRSLVPVAPVLWAALGIVGRPREGDSLLGDATAERRAWRYAGGDEAIDFIHVTGPRPRLLAEVRRADRILGVADAELGLQNRPVAAEMRFPRPRSTFAFTVRRVDTVDAFPADTWRRP